MKALRRVAGYVVVPLAALLAAGYIWYRVSDTGKSWQYEEKLATYCDGLIPYEESAVFTGLDTEVGLPRDGRQGFGDDSYHSCDVADMTVKIGLIPSDATETDDGYGILSMLEAERSDYLPVAIGGGWRGQTDLRTTAIVLPCDNKPTSVIVSVAGDDSHANPAETRAVAELAAATARDAAGHFSCEAEFGGRVPKIAGTSNTMFGVGSATGACKGIRVPESQWVDWMQESTESSSALKESCVLGETKARDEVLYYLNASYGPYAQALRPASGEPDSLKARSGISRDGAWATASCPDGVRAHYSINATVYAAPNKDFLRSALAAFAHRSAAKHSCTDMKLPS